MFIMKIKKGRGWRSIEDEKGVILDKVVRRFLEWMVIG